MLKGSYRIFQRVVVQNLFLPFVFSKKRMSEAQNNQREIESIRLESVFSSESLKKRIWCHAASVGELESLWPLILFLAEQKSEIILTILSESARPSLERLKLALVEKGAKIAFCGYSPWEGHWSKALKALRPSLFITAKYEAWPDLWVSLKEEKVPLAIVSAQSRKSLNCKKNVPSFFSGGSSAFFIS